MALSTRFEEALVYAAQLHATQVRKDTLANAFQQFGPVALTQKLSRAVQELEQLALVAETV